MEKKIQNLIQLKRNLKYDLILSFKKESLKKVTKSLKNKNLTEEFESLKNLTVKQENVVFNLKVLTKSILSLKFSSTKVLF
jgi:hypothetical protein